MVKYGSVNESRYVNLYLTDELVQKIDSLAEKDERSRNFVIKKVLEVHLQSIEKK